MSKSHIEFVEAIYDERSEKYDDSCHVQMAQDYIHFAKFKEGEAVLDLACGTGLVTLLAKKEVGDRGHVVGVDISKGMLDVARRKSKRHSLDIDFINHDISDLSGLNLLPEGSRGFDVIICASALVLLPSPLQAIKHWASLLAPGGRFITDVAVEDASVISQILLEIGPDVGESLRWDQSWIKSEKSLERLLIEAGLRVERVFMTAPYDSQVFPIDAGPELFERAIKSPMFRNFGQDTIREKAKALFVEKFTEMAGSAGVIHEETKLYVGIAQKEIG